MLSGSGVFVTSIVVGTVACLVPFKVTRRPFMRDVVTYFIAAAWVRLAQSITFSVIDGMNRPTVSCGMAKSICMSPSVCALAPVVSTDHP